MGGTLPESGLRRKVMDRPMGIDKMVGKDCETGLANLKQLAEK